MRRITLTKEYGLAKGFVAEPTEFISYLAKHTANTTPILAKLTFPSIAVLISIHVDGEHQSTGLGKSLLLDFEERGDDLGAVAVILIADQEETQREGFDLEGFYRRCGYHRIAQTSSGPLMLKIL